MKRLYLALASFALTTLSLYAQPSGYTTDGYYRVRNKGSERYIYVKDNTGSYNLDVVDYGAIQLWKNPSRTISDPSSVIYIRQVTDKKYDLEAQGTGIYKLVQHYVTINHMTDGSYEVYASQSGVTKYLSDISTSDTRERGTLGDGGKLNYRKWYVDKIDPSKEVNYFGLKPTVEAQGKWYCPFYAAFPFRTVSPGMKVYTISIVDVAQKVAVLKEVEGDVPASTPVIVECQSENPSDNRIDLLMQSAPAIKGNLLRGTFFANDERPASKDSYVRYDAGSMRVLGTDGGKLTFVSTGKSIVQLEVYVNYQDVVYDCLAANHSYLPVPASMPAEFSVMTEEEYQKLGISGVRQDGKADAEGIYTMQGVQLSRKADTDGLPAGIYLVNGRKTVVR